MITHEAPTSHPRRANGLTPVQAKAAAQYAAGNLPRLVSHADAIRGQDGPLTRQRWHVKSARGEWLYLVTVTADCNGIELVCTCEANTRGNDCWHVAAVTACVEGELPYTNEARRRQAERRIPSANFLCGRPEHSA